MGRTLAAAVVTALSLLILHGSCPCAAARPMSTRLVSSGSSALAVPPSASEGAARWGAADADAAARAGKWLPYYRFAGGGLGAHYHPGYPKYAGYGYPEGKPTVWASGSGARPELGLGSYGASAGQLGKSPDADMTRQEQVAMWASLLNPSKGPTTPASWLPGNGADDEPADQAQAHDEPKALDGAAEGAEMDVPPGGGGVRTGQQPMWGFYPGSKNGK